MISRFILLIVFFTSSIEAENIFDALSVIDEKLKIDTCKLVLSYRGEIKELESFAFIELKSGESIRLCFGTISMPYREGVQSNSSDQHSSWIVGNYLIKSNKEIGGKIYKLLKEKFSKEDTTPPQNPVPLQKKLTPTKMIDLIDSPQKFNKKSVSTRGIFIFDSEVCSLFPLDSMKEEEGTLDFSRSISLLFGEESEDNNIELKSGCAVEVRGVFSILRLGQNEQYIRKLFIDVDAVEVISLVSKTTPVPLQKTTHTTSDNLAR